MEVCIVNCMETKYVSWRRVSTFKQNRSGLGLAAQADIIDYFIKRDGGCLIADYSECYTGKDLNGCIELRKAIAHAKREKAILIIAKSDRFRNCQEALGVLDEMGEGNIEFCDIPHTDRFTLTLFFALAEREALIVSIRTKQALKALKERGDVKLGAANEKYRMNYNNKDYQMKLQSHRKKGVTKNARFLEKKETVAFFKVLRRAFPDACVGEPTEWNWSLINTREENREKVFETIREFKEIDPTLFPKWTEADLDMENPKSQVKLANQLNTLHKSVLRQETINNTFNN